jgi:NAD(P)-dependent dehydrogenase (short-subunit alcohol dehydrogenase family)
MQKKPLHEQVVVVTGASTGLGRAIARGAAAKGAKVALAARNVEALENGVGEVERAAPRVSPSRPTSASSAKCGTWSSERSSASGASTRSSPTRSSRSTPKQPISQPDELRRVMDVNFLGVVNGFWAALPHLRESRGTFLHVSSALAYRGIPLQAAYCASKAAARTFLESARVELQKHGDDVAVSLVLPGAIDTPQFDRDRQKIGYQPQPIYEPEPFAGAVLHCCERPIRELPVGWGAQKLLWGQKFAPRVGDWMLRRTGWKSQHTDDPSRSGRPTISSLRCPAMRAPAAGFPSRPARARHGRLSAC